MSKKILVVGATGPTGRQLLKLGVQRGHSMTALARRPETLAAMPSVVVKQGDVFKPDTLDAALAGQDAVIVVLGIALRDAHKPTRVFSQGTQQVIEAMRRQFVSRLICQSSFGVGDSRADGGFVERLLWSLLLKGAYADKVIQEQRVRDSGLEWTLVRPTRLTNAPAEGKWRATTDHTPIGSAISRADVAAFLLDELERGSYVQKTVALGDA